MDNINVTILVINPDCFSGQRNDFILQYQFILPIFQQILTVSNVEVITGNVMNVPMNS